MFLRNILRSRSSPRSVLQSSNDNFCLSRNSTKCMSSSSTASVAAELSFENEKFQEFLKSLKKEFYDLRTNQGGEGGYKRMHRLSNVVSNIEQRGVLLKNLESLMDMSDEKDEDMKELVKEEREVYSQFLKKTEQELIKELLTLPDDDNCSSLIFEITAGVGGQEAMLFASELYDMYSSLIDSKGWDYEILEEDRTDISGLRHANVIIYGRNAYNYLKYEAGVHRVQRVPATEKSGRTHTSTATVAVIPRPDDVDVTINEKDLKIETKRASGAGGQHVNTTDSAVRIVHLPTGVAVESQSERSQLKNKEIALKRLQAKLYTQQVEAQVASTHATRKAQKGTSNRNEKIRTYNFVQDRVTDHRIQGGTVHNLKEFLNGGDPLIYMIDQLVESNRRKELVEMIVSATESASK